MGLIVGYKLNDVTTFVTHYNLNHMYIMNLIMSNMDNKKYERILYLIKS